MVSVRNRLKGIGEPAPSRKQLAFRGSFGRRTPRSMRMALDGMTDPGVSQWHYLGRTFKSENNSDSREAQGMTTDGARWYLCSNGSKRVIVFDDQWNRLFTVSPTSTIWDAMWNDPWRYDEPDDWGAGEDNPHLGALCVYENTLYVPVQGPRGVWRINLSTAAQMWLHPSFLPDNDLFPWCDIHPATGYLYTANYEMPQMLRAYDRETLQHRPEHDVPLAQPAIYFNKVQGGVFTDRGRLILVRCSDNAMYCYSSLNGHCFGSRAIGEDWSEVESVTVRPWNFYGSQASVHVFELDNDVEDDCYLHCFAVPDPSRL